MWEGRSPEAFLAGLLTALSLGILAGRGFATMHAMLFAALGVTFVVSVLSVYKSSRWAFVPVVLLFFVLGSFRFTAAYELAANDISHYAKKSVHVAGHLTEEPRITEDAKGQPKLRFTLAAELVKAAGKEEKATGGIYLYARGKTAEEIARQAKIGDKLEGTVKIRSPHAYGNPGQIDTPMLLRSSGITASGSVQKGSLKYEEAKGNSFLRFAASIRQSYREHMKKVMPKDEAATVFAMLFGGYDGIQEDVIDAFTTTGIVHILSVSGSHVSLLAAAIAYLGVLLRLPKAVTTGLVIFVVGIYCILSACVPPVIRAAVMGSLTFLAVALEREKSAGYLLLFTGLIMLLINPLLLYHISFQLSFMATAGLLYLAPFFRKKFLRKLPDFAAMSFGVTIGAQLATLPILAWYFGQISLSSLLANLVIAPVIDCIIIVALLAGIISFLPFLGSLLFVFGSLLFGIVREMTFPLAKMPGSMVYLPVLPLYAALPYYGALIYMIQPKKRRSRIIRTFYPHRWKIGAVFLAVLVFFTARYLTQPRELAVYFISVGQGDAALVVTPKGHAFLFDTGGTRDSAFDVGKQIDIPFLLHCGVRHIDAIFLSHAHEDHAAGAGSILHRLSVDHVYTAGEGIYAYARSMKLSDNDPVLRSFSHAKEGERLTVDSVTIETIYAPDSPDAKDNEASNVYRVTYGDASFLFTGDLIKEHEMKMLEQGISPACTVLKVGHHGSDTSTSEAFLKAAHPKYAVIEVGADNSFGHPKESVVERIEGSGIKLYRTDEDGAITFHTDGRHIRVEKYVND